MASSISKITEVAGVWRKCLSKEDGVWSKSLDGGANKRRHSGPRGEVVDF